jgi:hypothetical protein
MTASGNWDYRFLTSSRRKRERGESKKVKRMKEGGEEERRKGKERGRGREVPRCEIPVYLLNLVMSV